MVQSLHLIIVYNRPLYETYKYNFLASGFCALQPIYNSVKGFMIYAMSISLPRALWSALAGAPASSAGSCPRLSAIKSSSSSSSGT